MDYRIDASVLLVLSLAATIPAKAADIERGAQVFRACAACHSLQQGVHMTGPSLAHVWGRKAGMAKGFQRYSNALLRSGLVWDEKTLNAWLSEPQKLVPGTTMTFPGLANRQAREDVIAYLEAVDKGRAPQAQRGGGAMSGMMGRGQQKLDLRTAPPPGQVRSIRYCGDTYTVVTADGKTEKVWEFNLRFKTDSSPRGPAAGKPVIVGAGMQGDRASVVFASPDEISRFVRQECR